MAVRQREKREYKPGPTAGRQRVRGINSHFNDLRINGEKFRSDLYEVVTGARLRRSMEEASSITIDCYDSDRIVEEIIAGERADAEIDDIHFRIAAARRNGDLITLTFEDRTAAWMRLYKGPKKAFRDKVTRAEFVRSLVKEVERKEGDIPLYIPELHVVQPIQGRQRGGVRWDKEKKDRRAPALDNDDRITSKGAIATPTQVSNIERVLNVGLSREVSRKLLICAIMTTTQESNNENLTGGDADSVGMFQQRASMGWPASRDIEKDAAAFYREAEKVDKQNPNLRKTELCQAVQRSATPEAYAQWEREATRTVSIYIGKGGFNAISGTLTTYRRYAFKVERDETYWDATGRLASEVNWRRFVQAGIFYFISDDALLAQGSRARLKTDKEGIDEINYDWDMGKDVTEVTVIGRASHWAAPPGTVVTVAEGIEEVQGRYLVSTIDASLFSDDITITLKRPTAPKQEPRPEKVEKQVSFGDAGGFAGPGGKSPPLDKKGEIIGVPYAGTHTLGNWQSDNAIDIRVPEGTNVLAVKNGTITKVSGSNSDPSSRFNGYQVTIDDQIFYTHLSAIRVRQGQKVKGGTIIGRSGSANGVPHLHFAVRDGNPKRYLHA